MAMTLASVPAYSLPGAPPLPQPRAAGDPPDSSLATEILPAPPSLASVHQAAAAKQDPRKPSQPISYLPQHDPGTTFSSHWTTPSLDNTQNGSAESGGRRPKRVRVGKEAGGLTARSTFRGAFAATSVVEPIVMDDVVMLDAIDVPLDPGPVVYAELTASRANSVPASQPQESRRRGRPPKDKGKGKEQEDIGEVKVKEEPIAAVLPPADGPSSLRNQDHCSACRSLGSLVYCDSCTRAYHLWCLDPPMEASDLPEGENRWYCPACNLAKDPRPKPPPSFLSSLIQHVQSAPPKEFQLPDDVRTYFKNVGANTRGAYVDTSMLKPPRLNRLGQLEDRDPHRTKDRNGAPILCFSCGTSAFTTPTPVPPSASSTSKRPRRSIALSRQSSEGEWRSIVSCDYCSSHWHLDCLDPPLTVMPPFDKKWMCPNHVEHVLRIKPRIPKQNATVIDINRPGVLNNGNIEVIDSGDASYENKVHVDEVFINGRKYRIPERVIKLDFWNKLNNIEPDPAPPSPAMSVASSLTSLSSLDDPGPPPSTSLSSTPGLSRPDLSTWSANDLRGALFLLDFTQTTTNALPAPSADTPRPPKRAAHRPAPSAAPRRVKQEPLPDSIPLGAPLRTSRSTRAPEPVSVPHPAPSAAAAPAPSATYPDPSRKQPSRASKREVIYTLPNLDDDTDSSSSRPPAKSRKPSKRAPRKSALSKASSALPSAPAPAPVLALPSTAAALPALLSPQSHSHSQSQAQPQSAITLVAPSAPTAVLLSSPTPVNGTSPTKSSSTQTTPSLKIRLPRLSDLKPQPHPPQPPPTPTPASKKARRPQRRPDSATPSSSSKLDD